MFKKRPKDKYDFILGCDLLKDLGLDIQNSASQFVWNDIIIAMVPSGHWTKERIASVAASWNTKKVIRAKSTQKVTIFSISSLVVIPVEICTSPVYSSRSTFCISQCWFDGLPTLIRSGLSETISLAEVVSQTEHE